MANRYGDDTKYNNGAPIDTDTINEAEWRQCAMEWGEGDKHLQDLLFFCLKNKIKTIGSCSGHKGKNRPYVAFEINEKNNSIIDLIVNEINDKKGAMFAYISELEPDIKPFVSINFRKGENTEIFTTIQEICERALDNKQVEQDNIYSKTREFIESIKKPNIQQYIAYINDENGKYSNMYITSGLQQTYELIKMLHAKKQGKGLFSCYRSKRTDRIASNYFNTIINKQKYKISNDDLSKIATRPKDISISRFFQKIKGRARYFIDIYKKETDSRKINQRGD